MPFLWRERSPSRSYVDRKVKISLLTKQIIFIVCTTFFYILKIVFLLLIGYIVPIQSQIVIIFSSTSRT